MQSKFRTSKYIRGKMEMVVWDIRQTFQGQLEPQNASTFQGLGNRRPKSGRSAD